MLQSHAVSTKIHTVAGRIIDEGCVDQHPDGDGADIGDINAY